MGKKTQEELNKHELFFSTEKEEKLFLYFLFPVFYIFIFYSISKMNFDEKLPTNLENFCYENRWSKRKCREVSELHENLQKYEKYLNLISIDKD